ncbi:putative thiazole-containing bacteriocin maturation protein [Halobacillus rhizosphaerae]|uniref:putative thiazole-containing bacteriocin maturation protein n=1 Tax=Halobacillus rhizosphaerae TaxID=3064889 RepID=UPI00398B5D6E
MTTIKPSMLLKVKKGTFFMPESNGSVYFRNNAGSFRMEGSTIFQWVEKLLPMLNGENSLASLTNGLPPLHRDRVYEMTEVLYRNGFLRDVTNDLPHHLQPEIVENFASQIEYLESFGDSAARRFQNYREQKVLAVGQGPMFIGLVSAMLQSGLCRFRACITDESKTNQARLTEIEASAKEKDAEVSIEWEVMKGPGRTFWLEKVDAFDTIYYVSENGDIRELRDILQACQVKKKLFIPAFFHKGVGYAGPIISPDSTNCWESAWRSIHHSERNGVLENYPIALPAQAMLSNILVFEGLKKVTEIKEIHHNHHLFLLDAETLEGNWHAYKPHPDVTGKISVEKIDKESLELYEEERKRTQNELFYYFSELTSRQTGIFHHWEEGSLNQLPLSQCEIQTTDITSNPSSLFPSMTIAAMTHEEARREAGLKGIEQYVSPLKNEISTVSADLYEWKKNGSPSLYLGAGGSAREAVYRALQNMVALEGKDLVEAGNKSVTALELNEIDDDPCRFYFHSLAMMNKIPELALGEDDNGFPVVWVKWEEQRWLGSSGFNLTLALREALRLTVMQAQNGASSPIPNVLLAHNLMFEETTSRSIPAVEMNNEQLIHSVFHRLEQSNKELSIVKVYISPFSEDGYIDIYGVFLGEGGSQ